MKTNTQSAFTLVAAFVVIVLAAIFAIGVAYMCCACCKRAASIKAEHERRLTNELAVAESPVQLPDEDEWLFDIPAGATVQALEDGTMAVTMPDADAVARLGTVGSYRILCSTSLAGPWLETGSYTADATTVRGMMIEMARMSAEQGMCRVGWFRSVRE